MDSWAVDVALDLRSLPKRHCSWSLLTCACGSVEDVGGPKGSAAPAPSRRTLLWAVCRTNTDKCMFVWGQPLSLHMGTA